MTPTLKKTVHPLKQLNLIAKFWEDLKPDTDVGSALAESWKKKVELMDQIAIQNNVVIFLWNIYTNRILYMSDKVRVLSGLDPALYLAENGANYSLSQIHPDHLEPCMQLNKYLFDFCKEQGLGINSFNTYLNYLYKNGQGEYVQILQRGIVLEADTNGQPSLCLNFTYHVGHIKKRDAVGGIIVGPNGNLIFDYDGGKKCISPPKKISEQELKIIRLLGEGLATEAIAKKMFLSRHTINTHRRNLIKKTSCADATGVVAFARMIGLI